MTFDRGTVTHGDMTRGAILQVARDVFLDNPNSEVVGSSQRISSLEDSADEKSLVNAYYGRKETSITNTFKSAIQVIQEANADVDLKNEEDLAKAHFDCEQFQAGQNRLIRLRGSAASSIRERNFDLARQETGQLLHTLQDFYSHSNWLENGNLNIYRVLGRVNERPEPVADVDQPTCLDCEVSGTVVLGRIISYGTRLLGIFGVKRREHAKNLYSCSDNLRSYLREHGVLTSGYYTGSEDSYGQLIPKLEGKCNHGGFLDSTSDLSATGGINKDSTNEEWSPHHYHHVRAAQMAEEVTIDILQLIREDVNDDALFA